jgi:hypothetical protein
LAVKNAFSFFIGRAPDYGSWANTHKFTSAARTC